MLEYIRKAKKLKIDSTRREEMEGKVKSTEIREREHPSKKKNGTPLQSGRKIPRSNAIKKLYASVSWEEKYRQVMLF
jgi:DNA helicase TIP49 (TBP-interacting protein)